MMAIQGSLSMNDVDQERMTSGKSQRVRQVRRELNVMRGVWKMLSLLTAEVQANDVSHHNMTTEGH